MAITVVRAVHRVEGSFTPKSVEFGPNGFPAVPRRASDRMIFEPGTTFNLPNEFLADLLARGAVTLA